MASKNKEIIQWFKCDADLPNKLPIKTLRAKYGLIAEARYIRLKCALRTADGYRLDFGEVTFNGLAEDWKCKPEEVREFIEYAINPCKLIIRNGDSFYMRDLSEDMRVMEASLNRMREGGRMTAEKRWGASIEEKIERLINEAAGPFKVAEFLRDYYWPQRDSVMEKEIYDIIVEKISKSNYPIFIEAVSKYFKYGGSEKEHPANYFLKIIEDKLSGKGKGGKRK